MPTRERAEPIFDQKTLADQVYTLRHARRWSQRQLGEAANVHEVTIAKLEKEKLPGVTLDTVVRLAKALGVSVNDLIEQGE